MIAPLPGIDVRESPYILKAITCMKILEPQLKL